MNGGPLQGLGSPIHRERSQKGEGGEGGWLLVGWLKGLLRRYRLYLTVMPAGPILLLLLLLLLLLILLLLLLLLLLLNPMS